MTRLECRHRRRVVSVLVNNSWWCIGTLNPVRMAVLLIDSNCCCIGSKITGRWCCDGRCKASSRVIYDGIIRVLYCRRCREWTGARVVSSHSASSKAACFLCCSTISSPQLQAVISSCRRYAWQLSGLNRVSNSSGEGGMMIYHFVALTLSLETLARSRHVCGCGIFKGPKILRSLAALGDATLCCS